MRSSSIIHAMELSGTAYAEQQPTFEASRVITIDDAKGVLCYLREKGSLLEITFCGSNGPGDWKTNLTFSKQIIPYGNTTSPIRVHSGFLAAYKRPIVRDTIHSQVKPNIQTINISGHSQGAALAVLCAVDLQYNFPTCNISAFLFGCPRIGNHAFQKSYNQRVFRTVRVENGNDIVTKVPFLIMRYYHVGSRVHIGVPRLPFIFSAKDHYPHLYYQNLIKRFW